MQWPPTSPGVKGRKFHLVAAAASTSPVSMPRSWKIEDSSFMKAMLRSRCVFSITFAASATLIEGARWMPAVDHGAVDAATMSSGRLVLPGDHLRDRLEAVQPVARIDALRRVAEGEVAAG